MSASSPFGIHAAAYWLARGAYETFRDQKDGRADGYDEAVTTLVMAAHEAAVGAIKCPAKSYADFAAKVAIFEHEGLHDDGDGERVRGLLDLIADDISKLAPASYPTGETT